MRIAVGLLAVLSAGALTLALADPPTDAAAATTAASTAPAPEATADAAVKAAAEKAELDKDTQHFLAEGYRPEMRRGEQVYCKKETALGSRLASLKRCGTIEQLKLSEQAARDNVSDLQRAQVGTSFH